MYNNIPKVGDIMTEEMVYPVWIWKKENGTYKAKSFDYDIISQAQDETAALEVMKEKIQKRIFFLKRDGLDLPAPGSVPVDDEDKYIGSRLIAINPKAYQEFVEKILGEEK